MRNPALDGVRGLAVLMVVFAHYVVLLYLKVTPDAGSFITSLGYFGAAGVDLFFVLSGFLICGILLDNRSVPNVLRIFFLRRACRIVPLYWLLLLMTWAAMHVLPNVAPQMSVVDTTPMWAYASFTQNFAWAFGNHAIVSILRPTWTLAIEEQFYLFLPVLVLLFSRAGLLLLLSGLWLLGPYARFTEPLLTTQALLPWKIDGLMAGAILAIVVRDDGFLAARDRWKALVPVAVVGITFVAVATRVMGVMPAPFFKSAIVMAFMALVLWAHLEGEKTVGGLLASKPLVFLGQVSYGIYLLHQLVNVTMFRVLAGRHPGMVSAEDAGIALISTAVTLAVAVASFRWFEGPFIAFGHRFRYGGAPR